MMSMAMGEGVSAFRFRWGLLWTAVGAVAGIIGAAAALYPLLTAGPQLLHVSAPCMERVAVRRDGLAWLRSLDAKLCDSVDKLRVENLSEAIILTGNRYVRNVNASTFEAGEFSLQIFGWDNRRIEANGRLREFESYIRAEKLRVRTDQVNNLLLCPEKGGEFEIGFEYVAKTGAAWARTRVPYCFEQDEEGPAGPPVRGLVVPGLVIEMK